MSKLIKLNQLYKEYRGEFSDRDIVVGAGNPDGKLILIGEAPGKEEIKQLKPFVGMAGKNLSDFLDIIKIKREDIFITNTIKFRLSKVNPLTGKVINRPATKLEIEESRNYLLTEISIINPEYIVTLGNVPLNAIVEENKLQIGQVHGKVQTLNVLNREYKLFPLYHPASIIYKRELKEIYISDIIELKRTMTFI